MQGLSQVATLINPVFWLNVPRHLSGANTISMSIAIHSQGPCGTFSIGCDHDDKLHLRFLAGAKIARCQNGHVWHFWNSERLAKNSKASSSSVGQHLHYILVAAWPGLPASPKHRLASKLQPNISVRPWMRLLTRESDPPHCYTPWLVKVYSMSAWISDVGDYRFRCS